MIDFKEKRNPVKSEKERLFDSLNAEYTAKFETPYVFDFAATPMTWDEAIEDIQRCITSGKPQSVPEYKPGVDY